MSRSDPAPLSASQIRALRAVTVREFMYGIRIVHRETDRWRASVDAIPDASVRAAVRRDFEAKRTYLQGAALFWTLIPRREPALARLLVALQVLGNHLDGLSEEDAGQRAARGCGWMTAVQDAVDLSRAEPTVEASVYREAPAAHYYVSLVHACRVECAALPGYGVARDVIAAEARRGRSMDLEHIADSAAREASLRTFAQREFGQRTGMAWWELTAASTSLLALFVALALAADGDVQADDLHAAVETYRSVALLSALLDNYVDLPVDRRDGNHNYFDMYSSDEAALARLQDVCERTIRAAVALRNGERHVVLIAAMIAMFLTNKNARSIERRATTRAIVRHAGSVTRSLYPVLSAWRSAEGLHTE